MSFMSIQTIGKVGNSPRFYKQGKRLALNGFAPGVLYSAEIDRDEGIVVLRVNPHGTRVVSKKAGSGDDVVPVIDVQSIDALSIFDGMDKIRVIVEDGQITLMGTATEIRRRERTERLRRKLESGEPLSIGSTSHGIGVLSHAIHSGIEKGGLHAELAFANDIEPAYLEQSEAHNTCVTDDTVLIAAPLQELAFDMQMLGRLKNIDVLEAGIPCTGASVAGRAKKHLAKPEDDPNVGHLIVGFLTLVQRLNPAIAILENVTPYMNSASYSIYKTQMLDFGYEVHETVLEGAMFGALENRKRMCAVAITRGIEFSFDLLEMPTQVERTVGEILDPIGEDDSSWSEMAYLKVKEVRDAADGKGFKRQEVLASHTQVPTVTRGYNKRRSTDPMLVHPTRPELIRLFTVGEHARIKSVPEQLVKGMNATRGHEALGQGICYAPFYAVGKAVADALIAWKHTGFILRKLMKKEDVVLVEPVESVQLCFAL